MKGLPETAFAVVNYVVTLPRASSPEDPVGSCHAVSARWLPSQGTDQVTPSVAGTIHGFSVHGSLPTILHLQ